MAINIGAGFNPSTQEPIDSRFIAATAVERLAIPYFNSYVGLIVFQQDTKELYVCMDKGDINTIPTWELLNTSNTVETLTIEQELSVPIIASSRVNITPINNNEDIITVNSGSNVPLIVNSEGLIVLDEYTYTPNAIVGGLLYSGSEFYLGLQSENNET